MKLSVPHQLNQELAKHLFLLHEVEMIGKHLGLKRTVIVHVSRPAWILRHVLHCKTHTVDLSWKVLWGEACIGCFGVLIDLSVHISTTNGRFMKEHLRNTCVHELLHLRYPEKTENEIRQETRKLKKGLPPMRSLRSFYL